MAYANTEYEFWGNPKVRAAGKDAAIMYIAACGYCNQFLTDGFISHPAIETISFLAFQKQPKKTINLLLEQKLWLEVEGGYLIHDFLKHNKSKAQIEEIRAKNSAAGKASAQARSQPNVEQNVERNVERNVEQSVERSVEQSVERSVNHNDNDNYKDKKKEAAARIFKAYESEIGVISSTISNDILDCMNDFPEEWFLAAFEESARQNKRNWKYALAIMKRWSVDGFRANKKPNQQKQRTRTLTDPYGNTIEVAA